jgi:hypothetical protein
MRSADVILGAIAGVLLPQICGNNLGAVRVRRQQSQNA